MQKKYYFALFLISLFIFGLYSYYNGICMSPDSKTYSSWADELIKDKFNFALFIKSQNFPVPVYFYAGFISLVALSKLTVGANWGHLIVILNIVFASLTAVLLAYLVYAMTKDIFTVWVAFILCILNPEFILWTRYVLSDISFMFVNFTIFFLFAIICIRRPKRYVNLYMAAAIFMLFLNICYRPTGLVMIPVGLLGFYFWKINTSRNAKHGHFAWGKLFFFFSFLVIIAIVLHASLIKNPKLWPFGFAKNYFNQYVVTRYQSGAVIDARYHTYHTVSGDIGGYAFVTADKLVHFFYFTDKLYSPKHNIVNSIFFIPTYMLFMFGLLSVFGRKIDLGGNEFLVALAFLTIFSFALYHSMNIIDFDWRYRLPTMPYILFISSFGIHFIKRRFIR